MRALRIFALVLLVVALAPATASARCARDGAVTVRAPQRVASAAVYVDGRRRGTVRRGTPRRIRVPAGARLRIRLVGRTRTGRLVTRLIRARDCSLPAPLPVFSGRVAPTDPRLRFEGRWDIRFDRAATVNSGARVIMRFTGDEVTAGFETAGISQPPQLYVWLDGRRGEPFEVDRRRIRLTPEGLPHGTHTLVLAAKDISQDANRWYPPFQSALRLTGFDLGSGAMIEELPAAAPLRFTFLGDSITQGLGDRCVVNAEGVSAPPSTTTSNSDCSDATIAYPWRVAGRFRAPVEQVGFSGQGVTVGGTGNVPPAPRTLDWNFAGSSAGVFDAHVVVINQGTNDLLARASKEAIRAGYLSLLHRTRERYPNAWIVALEIFGIGAGTETGETTAAIREAVEAFADSRTTFVGTRGWLDPVTDFTDSIHPNDSGHRHATEHLVAEIARLTGARPVAPLDSAPGSHQRSPARWSAPHSASLVASS